MAENTDENETTEAQTVEDTETAEETPELEERDEKPDRGNREAAKYRRQLRDTEAERDGLRSMLSAARQHILHAELNEQERSLLALTQRTPDEFFTDDGKLDPEAVRAARGQWRQEYASLLGPKRVPNTWDRPETRPTSDFKAAFGPKND